MDNAHVKPMVRKATNATTSTSNSFDTLNTLVDEDDCGGMNPSSTKEPEQVEGNGKKDINTTERINKVEKQMLDVPLMLMDGNGKPLNKVDSDPVDLDRKSEVEVAYYETAQFMTSRGVNDSRLYEEEDYDIYDTFLDKGFPR
ncbi:hypothetical protein Tco_1370370 [Tanacetum coccineum]